MDISDGVLIDLKDKQLKINNEKSTGAQGQRSTGSCSRKSSSAGKGPGESWGIDGGDGNIPAAVLGKLAFKDRLR